MQFAIEASLAPPESRFPTVAATTAAGHPDLHRWEPARTSSARPVLLSWFPLVSMNYVNFERIIVMFESSLDEIYLISSLNIVLKFSYWRRQWGLTAPIARCSSGRRQQSSGHTSRRCIGAATEDALRGYRWNCFLHPDRQRDFGNRLGVTVKML